MKKNLLYILLYLLLCAGAILLNSCNKIDNEVVTFENLDRRTLEVETGGGSSFTIEGHTTMVFHNPQDGTCMMGYNCKVFKIDTINGVPTVIKFMQDFTIREYNYLYEQGKN